MSDKRELVEKATGWCLSIFVYGTAIFYFVTKCLKLSGDDLDAYVSLLSAGATLFAGFIAIYLFTDWKEQHNKVLFSHEAKDLWLNINDIENILIDLKLSLEKSSSMQLAFSDLSSYHKKYAELNSKIEIFENNLSKFIALTKDLNLYAPYNQYTDSHLKYSNYYKVNFNSFKAVSTVKSEEKPLREALQAPFIILKDQLHDYIIIK